MIMKNDNDGGQLTISQELLLLLGWLVARDEEKLKKIITKALNAGLHQELQKISYTKSETPDADQMHYNISDFFSLMELLLVEAMNAQVTHNAKQQNLIPTLEHIDSTVCDDETVRSSLEKATTKMAHNPNDNPKDILYTELLKRWKPTNKNTIS